MNLILTSENNDVLMESNTLFSMSREIDNYIRNSHEVCFVYKKIGCFSVVNDNVHYLDISELNVKNDVTTVNEMTSILDKITETTEYQRKEKIQKQWISFIMFVFGKYKNSVISRHLKIDHATVNYSIRKIKERYWYDADFRKCYASLIMLCMLKNAECFHDKTIQHWRINHKN